MKYLKHQKQQGFSLIEVMVAMVIGMVLLGGAISIFISNKGVYRLESELSRMQESGRFIIDMMSNEIRMAGYNGCASRGDVEPNVMSDNPPPLAINNDNAVLGFDGSGGVWDPVIPAGIAIPMYDIDGVAAKDLVLNTDVLNIMRTDECGAYLTGNWLTTNANLQVTAPNSCGFAQNSSVIVTDCATADVFQISNNPSNTGTSTTLTHATNGNTGNFLSSSYGPPDAHISVPRSNSFFIALNDAGENALYLAEWGSTDADGIVNIGDFSVYELTDGVQDMQILYGEDTGGGGGNQYADDYLEADAVADWTNIRSVRINILLQSDDNITTEPRDFTFNGANANTGNDQRLRMAFSTTIALRNRLP
ncbi:MAG: prepilin-type N-terminal cleavage/methylation domain-containing protein [Xanthomonadales bacterium]|nr:prepilin-type N-terminal cleavage/methylation domain-containing protein [Xanthomonadales bacterium]